MAKQWYLQMTAYAIMVEELTGKPIEEITAIVGVEGMNTFQIFTSTPEQHVEELFQLRQQYENLYGMINIYHNEVHRISVVHDFITEEECEEILTYSWQNLEPANVISSDGKGMKHEGRTNSQLG